MFPFVWIIVWAFIFGIFNHPSALAIIGFIWFGIIPPVIAFIHRHLK